MSDEAKIARIIHVLQSGDANVPIPDAASDCMAQLEAIAPHERSAATWAQLADPHWSDDGNKDMLLHCLTKAAELGRVRSMYNLGMALLQIRRSDEAMPWFRAVIAHPFVDPVLHDNCLSVLMIFAGGSAEAERLYDLKRSGLHVDCDVVLALHSFNGRYVPLIKIGATTFRKHRPEHMFEVYDAFPDVFKVYLRIWEPDGSARALGPWPMKKASEGKLCTVCKKEPAEVGTLPCRHRVLCRNCLWDTECVVCKTPIKQWHVPPGFI